MEGNDLLEALKLMYSIRFFEEYAKKMYKKNLLAGSFMGALHSYIGQEAIAVGISLNLNRDDYVFSTHRGHGHFIAKGGSIKKMLAELMGKETGCSAGRGGSMHLFDKNIGFMGGNGIVGAGIPLALGAAYYAGYMKTKQVAVSFFGDGAASQGTFHESLNLASLWKLPVIFVCENNCYAVNTPVSETVCIPDIAARASGYGMPGETVDGNSFLKVHESARKAVGRARNGEGPTLLECKTYRIDPHCMVITETRKKQEIEEWRKKDPVSILEDYLKKEKKAGEQDIEKIKREALEEIAEAEKFAGESPFPDGRTFIREQAK